MNPLISAIIPTYNRADLLGIALASVAAQDYRPMEAVVIDDGSTDRTPEVLIEQQRKLEESDIRLVVYTQQNGRAPLARNNGMRIAKGSLFAFLDSDDIWQPSHISTAARLLNRYPSAGLSFCKITCIDLNGTVLTERDPQLPSELPEGLLAKPFERIIRYMPFQTSGVVVRRQVIEEVGNFDLSLPIVEDWDLWYRISKSYDFAYTLQSLACNRGHSDNLPKYDSVALSSNVRMNLKHLPDVKDSVTRMVLVHRISQQILLLQEQVLREGGLAGDADVLLRNELAPNTIRYHLGTIARSLPSWAGCCYASMISWGGKRQRAKAAGLTAT